MSVRRLPGLRGLNLLLALAVGLNFAGTAVVPTALAAPPVALNAVDAKIEIVWPHGPGTGQLPVSQAPLANITAYLFEPGTLNPVPDNFNNTVRLWRATNNDPAQMIATGQKRMLTQSGHTFPVWDFNDIDVSGANDPVTKYFFFLDVEGIATNFNVWSHGADARTYSPNPQQPLAATGSGQNVDAHIQIVWPHDQAGRQRGVTEASLANVTVALFQSGGLNSVPPEFGGTVRLYRSINNDPAEMVGTGTKRITDEGGVAHPVWDFNDIDVHATRDRRNKIYFTVRVDGSNTNSSVWSHGADARTYFPQVDTPFGTPAEAPVAPPPSPPVASVPYRGGMGYGIQAHLLNGSADRIYGAIKDMGFNWVKQQIEWFRYHPGPGQYNWGEIDQVVDTANANGINLLLSVVKAPRWARPGNSDFSVAGPPANPQDMADFMGAMAARYRGRVKAYEIWNEQNLWYEWGHEPLDAGRYVELLRACYAAIKAQDPAAVVVSGALTPTGVNDGNIGIDDAQYLEQMYQAGLKGVSDAIGVHPSGYNNPPDATWDTWSDPTAPDFKGHRSFFFRSTMEQYRNIMIKYGDSAKKLWATEFGWASIENVSAQTATGYGYAANNTELEQAQFLVRAFEIAKGWGWVGPMFVWNLNFGPVAGPNDEKAAFGIVRPDWSPRAAYAALRDMPK